MKSVLLFIIVIVFCSCNANKKIARTYYYVEPFKEQEIKLFLKDDSTFNFQDLTGCNQFEFRGKYTRTTDSGFDCFIFDSVKPQNIQSGINDSLVFYLKNGDTAWIINKERIFIHKQPFSATTNGNLDLQEIRFKKLKDYYIGLLGKEGFIKLFGNGKSLKEAKRRLLECKLPDINIK